jgi:hypothetical protein
VAGVDAGLVDAGVVVRGLVVGGDVESGGVARAAGQDVEGFARGAVGDEGVGGVDGAALDPVGVAGVQKLDVGRDVGGGQGDAAAVPEVPDGQRPVPESAGDFPCVAVFDPVPPGEQGQAALGCSG